MPRHPVRRARFCLAVQVERGQHAADEEQRAESPDEAPVRLPPQSDRGEERTEGEPSRGPKIEGSVERIALKVRKQDALGTDPAARKDGRIVEVEIRLADAAAAAALTNLQVEIQIGL